MTEHEQRMLRELARAEELISNYYGPTSALRKEMRRAIACQRMRAGLEHRFGDVVRLKGTDQIAVIECVRDGMYGVVPNLAGLYWHSAESIEPA